MAAAKTAAANDWPPAVDLTDALLKDEDPLSSDSSSSSSEYSDSDSEEDDEFAGMSPSLSNALSKAPASASDLASASSPPRKVRVSAAAQNRWIRAGQVVRTQVRVKLGLEALLSETKLGRALAEKDKKWFMTKLFMTVVFLSVMDTETKACAFHLSAVGMYSVDGKPYKFSYSLFVALAVFLMKLGLGPLERMAHKAEKKEIHAMDVKGCSARSNQHHHKSGGPTPKSPHHEGKTPHGIQRKHTQKEIAAACQCGNEGKPLREKMMPYLLLLGFTFAEMMSTALANYALNMTPTSIYIVFKSSKMVFVAIASRVFLGAQLRWAQWAALALLVASLLLATVAESKTGKKDGGMSYQGPIILLISEFSHALMLVMQQVAVQSYWPDPMLLVSASAALGIPVTISSMIAAHKMQTTFPPHHPISDPVDVFVMCSNSLALTVALVTHLGFHVAMDVNHIVSLKHMSSLARSLCDAVKLGVMWVAGKAFWFSGELIWGAEWPHTTNVWSVIAEPWLPNSWMMIPGLFMIGYAMLMFKFKVFLPIRFEKDKNGKWHAVLHQDDLTEAEMANPYAAMDVCLDDGFYGAAFRNRKVRQATKKRMGDLLDAVRADKKPVNKIQAAVAKMRLSQAAANP